MAPPNVISGQAIGTSLTVLNSTALAALPIQGISLGSSCYNLAVGSSFILTLSNAALVTDQVVAVNGVAGMRWIFTDSGGGKWLNALTQYVSPTGNDANDGLGWPTAKATMWKAAQAISVAGGGTMYVASRSQIGGPSWTPYPGATPVTQGLILRSDGLAFLPGNPVGIPAVPMAIIGIGDGLNTNGFSFAETAMVQGNSNNFLTPAITLINTIVPITVKNIRTPGLADGIGVAGMKSQFRYGWDYMRNNDGTLLTMPITQAARSGSSAATGTTTYTITAPTYNLVQASRSVAGIVTGTFQLASNTSLQPAYAGCPIVINSSNPNFNSGTFTLLSGTDQYGFSVLPGGLISLTWNDGSSTPQSVQTANMTYTTHGCQKGDVVSLFITASAGGQFQTTSAALVTSVTATTVTVRDVTGYSPRSLTVTQTNPTITGYLVKQERGRLGAHGIVIENTDGTSGINNGPTTDDPTYGPVVDIGSTTIPNYISQGRFAGFEFNDMQTDFTKVDLIRASCPILFNAGVGSSAFSWQVNRIRSQQGGIEAHPYGPQFNYYLTVSDVLGDASYQQPVLNVHGFELLGGSPSGAVIQADNIQGADDLIANTPVVFIGSGFTQTNVRIGSIAGGSGVPFLTNLSPIIGPTVLPGLDSQTPWQSNRVTVWNGNRLTGYHPAAARAMGPVSARAANFWGAPSGWSLPSGVTASSVSAPDGNNTATRLTNTNVGFSNVVCSTGTGSFATNGYLFIGGWINTNTAGSSFNQFQIVATGSMVLTASNLVTPQNIPGWQWLYTICQITTAGDSAYATRLNINGVSPGGVATDLWGMTACYFPPTLPAADVYEAANNLKHQPYYLQAGLSGTMEGQSFTGHGGLVVGDPTINTAALALNNSPSAPTPLTGTTANLRWNNSTGKIEYCKPGGAWTTLV